MSTSILPAAKKRLAIFKQMPPDLQKVAVDFDTRLGRGTEVVTLIHYDIGAQVSNVIDNEKKYGSEAVKQLAAYLNMGKGETTLYNLRNFAKAFERDFVSQQSTRSMTDGGRLTPGHWYQLMKVAEPKNVTKLLDRTFEQSLSVHDLEKEIKGVGTKHARQGGRKPKQPSSPIAGLQKTFSLAQQLSNFGEMADKAVFDAIDEMAADKVTPELLAKLGETKDTVETAATTIGEISERLEGNIKRVTTCLAKQKTEKPEEAKTTAGKTGGKKKKHKVAA